RPGVYYDRMYFDFHMIPTSDDICGLLHEVTGLAPGTTDTLDVAWVADNDGDPLPDFTYPERSARGILGARILRAPKGGRFNFNWWAFFGGPSIFYQWSPRRAKDANGYVGAPGQPLGDRSRYHLMTNGELDYDQAYTAVPQQDTGWSLPPALFSQARDCADGADVTMLLSSGPLPDLAPGDSMPFTYALIAGSGFHTNPHNFADRFTPNDPGRFLAGVDFSNLITNARWAERVFDKPGFDTDGDGNRGEYQLVDCRTTDDGTFCDTLWTKGDGVPDWSGPESPYGPTFEVTTRPSHVILRWNGRLSETTKDAVSRRRDFEGYRVYSSHSDVPTDFALIASWDKIDYSRWAYRSTSNDWRQISYPLTADEWKVVMDDPSFDPLQYSRPSFSSAFHDTVRDTVLDPQGVILRIVRRARDSYWAPEGPNRENNYYGTDRWETNRIQRIDQRDTTVGDESFTYGVYEFTLDNLNGSQPLYFAVTAFDYGDYRQTTPSLESTILGNSQFAFPIYSSDVVIDSGLRVSVYPNPYKSHFLDAFGHKQTYHSQGYEAPGRDMTAYDRRIWFINLPDTATIRIYTLDGDLVREIDHPDKFLTTYSSAVGWDLISRNTQEVESGIYIYRVDSRLGAQVGKIVIIK
ncbi:MAG: T9SS type A sorting domain-containing protein, partial [candidate division Zixibacteria bacterium]|nr:T9SS type A sorting domain-containing protein [candidate division Zixibacteria bacterium]